MQNHNSFTANSNATKAKGLMPRGGPITPLKVAFGDDDETDRHSEDGDQQLEHGHAKISTNELNAHEWHEGEKDDGWGSGDALAVADIQNIVNRGINYSTTRSQSKNQNEVLSDDGRDTRFPNEFPENIVTKYQEDPVNVRTLATQIEEKVQAQQSLKDINRRDQPNDIEYGVDSETTTAATTGIGERNGSEQLEMREMTTNANDQIEQHILSCNEHDNNNFTKESIGYTQEEQQLEYQININQSKLHTDVIVGSTQCDSVIRMQDDQQKQRTMNDGQSKQHDEQTECTINNVNQSKQTSDVIMGSNRCDKSIRRPEQEEQQTEHTINDDNSKQYVDVDVGTIRTQHEPKTEHAVNDDQSKHYVDDNVYGTQCDNTIRRQDDQQIEHTINNDQSKQKSFDVVVTNFIPVSSVQSELPEFKPKQAKVELASNAALHQISSQKNMDDMANESPTRRQENDYMKSTNYETTGLDAAIHGLTQIMCDVKTGQKLSSSTNEQTYEDNQFTTQEEGSQKVMSDFKTEHIFSSNPNEQTYENNQFTTQDEDSQTILSDVKPGQKSSSHTSKQTNENEKAFTKQNTSEREFDSDVSISQDNVIRRNASNEFGFASNTQRALSFPGKKQVLELHSLVSTGYINDQSIRDYLIEHSSTSPSPVHMTDTEQRTPLHLAAQACFFAGIEILLNADADVNARDRQGNTPLFLCIAHQEYGAETAEYLLAIGADARNKDNAGNTALHLAVFAQSEQCISVLLKAVVSGNEMMKLSNDTGEEYVHESLLEVLCNDEGDTPLHLIAAQGWRAGFDVFKQCCESAESQGEQQREKLISSFVQVLGPVKNKNGYTAAECARNVGALPLAAAIEEMAQIDIANSSNLNTRETVNTCGDNVDTVDINRGIILLGSHQYVKGSQVRAQELRLRNESEAKVSLINSERLRVVHELNSVKAQLRVREGKETQRMTDTNGSTSDHHITKDFVLLAESQQALLKSHEQARARLETKCENLEKRIEELRFDLAKAQKGSTEALAQVLQGRIDAEGQLRNQKRQLNEAERRAYVAEAKLNSYLEGLGGNWEGFSADQPIFRTKHDQQSVPVGGLGVQDKSINMELRDQQPLLSRGVHNQSLNREFQGRMDTVYEGHENTDDDESVGSTDLQDRVSLWNGLTEGEVDLETKKGNKETKSGLELGNRLGDLRSDEIQQDVNNIDLIEYETSEQGSPWALYHTSDGFAYYYNHSTGESKWANLDDADEMLTSFPSTDQQQHYFPIDNTKKNNNSNKKKNNSNNNNNNSNNKSNDSNNNSSNNNSNSNSNKNNKTNNNNNNNNNNKSDAAITPNRKRVGQVLARFVERAGAKAMAQSFAETQINVSDSHKHPANSELIKTPRGNAIEGQLIQAVEDLDINTLRILINSGASPAGLVDSVMGCSLLHVCCSIAAKQVKRGHDVFVRSKEEDQNYSGQTSRTERIVCIATMLEESGCDIDGVDSDGTTPLHLAAQEGNAPLVEFLLQCAARVDIPDKQGETALHFAATGLTRGHLFCVKLLAKYGASLLIMNENGMIPEECALLGLDEIAVPSKVHVSIVELLRELTECVRQGGGEHLNTLENNTNSNQDIGFGGKCIDLSKRSATQSPFDSVVLGSKVVDSDELKPVNPFRLRRNISSGSGSPIGGLYRVPELRSEANVGDGKGGDNDSKQKYGGGEVHEKPTGKDGWWSAIRSTATGMLTRNKNVHADEEKKIDDRPNNVIQPEVVEVTSTTKFQEKNVLGKLDSVKGRVQETNCRSDEDDDENYMSDSWRSADEPSSDLEFPDSP